MFTLCTHDPIWSLTSISHKLFHSIISVVSGITPLLWYTLFSEYCQALGFHPTTLHRQTFCDTHVTLTPHTLWVAGCETYCIGLLISWISFTIYPAKTHGFRDSVSSRNDFFPSGFSIVSNPELVFWGMVICKPHAQVCCFDETFSRLFRHTFFRGFDARGRFYEAQSSEFRVLRFS